MLLRCHEPSYLETANIRMFPPKTAQIWRATSVSGVVTSHRRVFNLRQDTAPIV
ncbi:hypothetical protein M404DRAFT_996812 [Pisolithus tinctorius Marx 270]|uniref:Uncharacterized protein n=1 Tax=Pisolithus tinctorius Marx 270 TaxID=870435 RepID=A0A0C3P6X7_PISTI|nr:hypothetical protein M404DRAFT_996812 [Pisolithus tinctorius Marx 270]